MNRCHDESARLGHPMYDLCDALGLSLRDVALLDGDMIPQPYRQLLVHDRDMTPTLEAFHRDSLHLRVLHKIEQSDLLLRQVLLVRDSDDKPVAYGAIRIHLGAFDEPTRVLIRQCVKPLGAILEDRQIPHVSRPGAFFTVSLDPSLAAKAGLRPRQRLYGRHNELSNPSHQPLAQVIEILSPVDQRV